MIKPNKNETVIITIMVSAAIGFVSGVLSVQTQMADKNTHIETLLEIVEDQEELIDRLLK